MTTNFKIVRRASSAEIMARPLFQMGVADYHAGVWNQALADQSANYERGRHFAAATGIRKIRFTKYGKPFPSQASKLKQLGIEGAII